MDLADRTIYSMLLLYNTSYSAFSTQGWNPCGSSHAQGAYPMQLEIVHEHWTEENLFGPSWQASLFPGSADPVLYPEFDLNRHQAVLEAHMDGLQRYVIEPKRVDPHSYSRLLCPSIDETTVLLPSTVAFNYFFTYTEGIGLTYQDQYYFEGGSTRELTGTMFAGVQVGMVTPDDLLLGVNDEDVTHQHLFPNPASGSFTLPGTLGGERITINDMEGRMVRAVRITTANELIDVHDLKVGLYVLRMDGVLPQRLMIAR